MGGKLLSCLTLAELGWRWLEGDGVIATSPETPQRKSSASSQSIFLNGTE